jgi:hypothetical protein
MHLHPYKYTVKRRLKEGIVKSETTAIAKQRHAETRFHGNHE